MANLTDQLPTKDEQIRRGLEAARDFICEQPDGTKKFTALLAVMVALANTGEQP